MDILGIGPLELLFILVIALIIFGPNDLVKAGRSLGKFMRRIVTSDGWRTFQQASRDIRRLPNQLMRDAGLDEVQNDLKQINPFPADQQLKNLKKATDQEIGQIQTGLSAWTTPSAADKPATEPANTQENEVPEGQSPFQETVE